MPGFSASCKLSWDKASALGCAMPRLSAAFATANYAPPPRLSPAHLSAIPRASLRSLKQIICACVHTSAPSIGNATIRSSGMNAISDTAPNPIPAATASRIDSRLPISTTTRTRTPASLNACSNTSRVVDPCSRRMSGCPAAPHRSHVP